MLNKFPTNGSNSNFGRALTAGEARKVTKLSIMVWLHWRFFKKANICWIIKKEREFQKNIHFCFIDYAKSFDCVDHNKL